MIEIDRMFHQIQRRYAASPANSCIDKQSETWQSL